MRSVWPSLMCGGGGTPGRRGRAAAVRRRRRRRAAPPPPARRPHGRRSLAGSLAVRIVVVPPLVRWGLRPALRRVLPRLLAPERRDIEKRPGGAQVLGTAGV